MGVQLSGVWAVVCILGGPGGDLGVQLIVVGMGCRLYFGRLWRLSEACTVVCILGGPGGGLGVGYGLSFAFMAAWGSPLSGVWVYEPYLLFLLICRVIVIGCYVSVVFI